MKALIVNADDFGMTAGVSRGIIDCHRDGIVTSTSLLANLPAFDDAIAKLRECPSLGVGVHLNLTLGAPLAGGLAGRNGRFPGLRATLAHLMRGVFKRKEVEREFQAQVERVSEAGVAITHLNSHHNIHLYPMVRECVYRVAARSGIGVVRFRAQVPALPPCAPAYRLAAGRDRMRYLAAWIGCGGWKPRARSWSRIYGVPQLEGWRLRDAIASVLAVLPEGATELVCHPGYADEELRGLDSYADQRDSEVQTLLDPALREGAARRGVALVHYGQI